VRLVPFPNVFPEKVTATCWTVASPRVRRPCERGSKYTSRFRRPAGCFAALGYQLGYADRTSGLQFGLCFDRFAVSLSS
jgi:hypothetical protein